jgi:hypothetical protein
LEEFIWSELMTNEVGLLSNEVEENSIFHTNKLRDARTKVHLVLVFVCFLGTLAMAIFLAETGGSNFPLAVQGKIQEKENIWAPYGKSE